MPFFTLFVRIFIELLTFPCFISCENLLDISAVFFLDLTLFGIVSASFNNSSKWPDIHDSKRHSKAFK